MRRLSSKEISSAVEGKLYKGNGTNTVSRVVTDSREAGNDDIFFALIGEKNDGHDYLSQVLTRGCRALVISDCDKVNKAIVKSYVVITNI